MAKDYWLIEKNSKTEINISFPKSTTAKKISF